MVSRVIRFRQVIVCSFGGAVKIRNYRRFCLCRWLFIQPMVQNPMHRGEICHTLVVCQKNFQILLILSGGGMGVVAGADAGDRPRDGNAANDDHCRGHADLAFAQKCFCQV